MNTLGSHDLYRSVLLDCLNLACTRVTEARLEALKITFSQRKSKSDASALAVVAKAVARVNAEEKRRLRIVSALKERSASVKVA
jgi:hypothetical protein